MAEIVGSEGDMNLSLKFIIAGSLLLTASVSRAEAMSL